MSKQKTPSSRKTETHAKLVETVFVVVAMFSRCSVCVFLLTQIGFCGTNLVWLFHFPNWNTLWTD